MSSRKAPRKTDAERGPLGAWAYGTRTLLDVATAEAAQAAGVTEPTLRKIEGGSTRQPARRVVWELWQYLAKRGAEQGIPVEDPPEPWRTPAGRATVPPAEGDVATAIRMQAESNDRVAAALERQAEAFTTLAASIDRAADGVTGKVAGFDELLRGLLVALGAPASEAPDEQDAPLRAGR